MLYLLISYCVNYRIYCQDKLFNDPITNGLEVNHLSRVARKKTCFQHHITDFLSFVK